MPTSNVYLFSLIMGLLGVLLVYFDSYQNSDNKPRCSYIKVFICASIISLITALYFTRGPSYFRSSKMMTGGNTVNGFGESPNTYFPAQQIMTGSPDLYIM